MPREWLEKLERTESGELGLLRALPFPLLLLLLLLVSGAVAFVMERVGSIAC